MFPCQRYVAPPLSRREMLSQAAHGFGAVALSSMLGSPTSAANDVNSTQLQSIHGTHFPAKAKHVIFLYMDGGPSQVDTFDPKPMLDKFHGKGAKEVLGKVEATQFANVGAMRTDLLSSYPSSSAADSPLPVAG